jgi:arabinofuranosyltransferase
MLLSILLTLGTAWLLVFKIARSLSGALLGLTVLTFSASFVDFSTSGLENPLTHLILATFFVVYYNQAADKLRSVFFLSLVTALAVLNRMDVVLVLLPCLASVLITRRSLKVFLAAGVAFVPFLLWELFSLLYYGFVFPNSAYSKLWTTGHETLTVGGGINYLLAVCRAEPLMFVALVCGGAIPFLQKEKRDFPVVAGMVAYVAYVVKIGGDFMGGRFLAAPLLCAAVLLSRSLIASRAIPATAMIAAAMLLGLCSPCCPVKSGGDYGAGPLAWRWDERARYYPTTGLFRRNSLQTAPDPDQPWVAKGRELSQAGPRVELLLNIGFAGFFAGPKAHIVDTYGLSDVFIARLPVALYGGPGHYHRRIPFGYLETLAGGRNVIEDDNLAAYYAKLAIITRGTIFSRERFAEIVRVNLGRYDHLADNPGASRLMFPGTRFEKGDVSSIPITGKQDAVTDGK